MHLDWLSVTTLSSAPLAGEVRFAVVTLDGRLILHSAPGRASDTRWGPYQEQLWAAVRADYWLLVAD